MRARVAGVAISLLVALPADAGWGSLLRAGASAGKASRAATPLRGASRAAGGVHAPPGASRVGGVGTHVPEAPSFAPIAPFSVAAPPAVRGAPRAVTHLDPDARRAAASVLAVRAADNAFALDAATTAARASDGPLKKSLEVADALVDIVETSADAAEALLDADDAARGDLDPAERQPLIDAEWARHAKRLKRIGVLERVAADDEDATLAAHAARLRDKELKRHARMLELADRRLQ